MSDEPDQLTDVWRIANGIEEFIRVLKVIGLIQYRVAQDHLGVNFFKGVEREEIEDVVIP